MLKFVIKTYTKGTIYKNPHLFILNKGLNSGKPSNEPFTNSFVIIFENKEDFDNINLTAYALWKTKFWHQFLCGSVIPFLRLHSKQSQPRDKRPRRTPQKRPNFKAFRTI